VYWRKLVFVPWKYARDIEHVIIIVIIVTMVMGNGITKGQIG